MRRILWTTGVIGALLFAGVGGSPALADFPLPEEDGVQAQTLSNGMLVLVRERPSTEVAAISVGIRGGSRDEEPATVGARPVLVRGYAHERMYEETRS